MKIIDIMFFTIIFILLYYAIKNNYLKSANLVCNPSEDYDLSLYDFKNYKNLNNNKIPKIFIHYQSERNGRNWESFGSRMNFDYNLELANLCIKSIINVYSSDYDIVIYNDNDVKKLINDVDDVICNISDPSLLTGVDLEQWTQYCKTKILYLYGGVIMEPMFYFLKNKDSNKLFKNNFTVANLNNSGLNVSNKLFTSNSEYLMSSPAYDENLLKYCNYLKDLCINNYSVEKHYFNDESEFLNNLHTYDKENLGIIDANGLEIHVEDLLSNNNLELHNSTLCVFIDINNLKKYTKNGWILKMNKEQILESNTAISNIMKNDCL
tara:strand:+ start:298 stop:1266 length:969 start_codon:yes stop_codon:yes gene_type:complete